MEVGTSSGNQVFCLRTPHPWPRPMMLVTGGSASFVQGLCVCCIGAFLPE